MAKEKGKKFKRKGKKSGQPNAKIKKVKGHRVTSTKAVIPAPPVPTEPTASEPKSNSNAGASRGKENEMEKSKRLSGFIFMCNPSTKLECYQFRVFGLPMGKKDVVEEIKQGTKLFLFDFELKLLYGVYEATSPGQLNLEPAAFKGKFPAQVKFRIVKECLPLPESSLRHVIKENYTGSKFKQELSGKQVKKLVSSFRPLTASSSQPALHAMANVSLPRAMLPSAIENQFKQTVRVPAQDSPYIPRYVDPQSVPKVNFLQPAHHRPAAYSVRLPLDYQSLLARSSHYVADSQRPSFIEGIAHGVQEPPYSRYMTVEARARARSPPPQDQVTNLSRQYVQMPLQREPLYRDNVVAYSSNQTAVSVQQHTSSATQPQVQATLPHRLTLQRGARYNSSVSQPQTQDEAPYHPFPLQRETIYKHSNVTAAAYNSYSGAGAGPGLASSARYGSSGTQPGALAPGASQGSAPITTYYSYAGVGRLGR